MIYNKYWIFDSVVSPEKCQEIINLGLKQIELGKLDGSHIATVGGEAEKHNNPDKIPQGTLTRKEVEDKKLSTYIRDSEVGWIHQDWVYEIVQEYILRANKNAGWNFDIDWFETPQFTKYTGGGFYSWHSDGYGDHVSMYKPFVHGLSDVQLRKDGNLPHEYTQDFNKFFKVRKLSMTLNLTDPNSYEGGDLMFDLGKNEGDISTATEARNQGTIIVFPSFLYHCVSPVTKGIRYSLVNWSLGRPFK